MAMPHGRRARAGLVAALALAAMALVAGQSATKHALAGRAALADSDSHVPDVPPVDVRRGAPHELHETYADIAIEDATAGGRVRFYKQQLERALGPMVDADAVTLSPGAAADSLVLRYLRGHLVLTTHGDTLQPTLLRSGEEALEHHQGWWIAVHYEAAAPIDSLHVRNTLLFEVYDDQRNVMRFVHFPEETRQTVTFEAGAAEAVVEGW